VILSWIAQTSATRRDKMLRRRLGYGFGSPLLCRAQPSSLGPAEILPRRPSAKDASSDSVLGERPASIVAMITGQASKVDENRARTLFEGMSRSAYPTAPAMKISVFSPGDRVRRFGMSSTFEKSISGMKNSSSGSSFVRMSFALRGAPCGDDSRHRAALRRYHQKQSTARGISDHREALVLENVSDVAPGPSVFIELDRVRFVERHSVLGQIDARLLGIPFVARHRGTLATAPHLGLTS
jgi:hypothetical protein